MVRGSGLASYKSAYIILVFVFQQLSWHSLPCNTNDAFYIVVLLNSVLGSELGTYRNILQHGFAPRELETLISTQSQPGMTLERRVILTSVLIESTKQNVLQLLNHSR